MESVRRLVAQRQFAVLICAAALLMKVLVPGGYMVSNVAGWPAITLCPQAEPIPSTRSPAEATPIPHAGMFMAMHHDNDHRMPGDHGKTGNHGKAEMPCVFTALSAATLAATDPILLAAFIAFIVATAITGLVLPRLSEPARTRPPLRGPPAFL